MTDDFRKKMANLKRDNRRGTPTKFNAIKDYLGIEGDTDTLRFCIAYTYRNLVEKKNEKNIMEINP